MMVPSPRFLSIKLVFLVVLVVGLRPISGYALTECPYLYGIHDHDPNPAEYLSRISAKVSGGWVTATVAVGRNPNDTSGIDFRSFSNAGHTVICRINNGYGRDGTIPPPQYYSDFAQRCAKFVQNSQGCELWIIGNETNLACEWPQVGNRIPYVSPQSYAECFRLVYNAIKAVRPTHKVIPQPLAPWGGPYGAGYIDGIPHDPNPLNWVQYMNQMLTAIKNSGGVDGIALHVTSRGYAYSDIHSTAQVNANGQLLYFSFYVYKDWINYGIPRDLYHLPAYITECNGMYYWKGGHPEDPSKHYEPGWMQEVYAEINRYNQEAATTGKPIIRCICPYRWCSWCDGWNIDGASNPYKGQILSDLDAALTQAYRWPESTFIVDNSDAGFTVESGSWATGTTATDKWGTDYRYKSSGTGTAVVKWTPSLPTTGNYQVAVWYSAGTNRANNAPYTVNHKDGSQTFYVNQQVNGGQWNVLGTFPFLAGQGFVTLSDNAQASKVVIADAVRWTFQSPIVVPGTITGVVRNRAGASISGASVITSPGNYSATSGSDGRYTISNVPPGTYSITASKTGYYNQTVSGVVVPSGGTATQDFSLAPIGTNLLINGNFEGGFQASGVAVGWTPWTCSWSNTITFSSSTIAHGGSYSQRWGRSDSKRLHGGICQAVNVISGYQYVVDGWIRFQATDSGAWAEIGYDLTGQTSDGEASTVQYTKLESGGQNTWLYYTKTITATSSRLAIFFKFGQYYEGGSGPSWAYADDASITEVIPPAVMQSVTDDGVYQTSSSTMRGTWSATESRYGIAEYMYAISTSQSESGIIPGGGWLSAGTATTHTRTGLSLTNGQIYYILAKAKNFANQWSAVMASDGIRVVELVPDLAEAKKRVDGRWIAIENLVCTLAPAGDRMGLQHPDRLLGIKATKGSGTLPSVSPGAKLTVMGRLASTSDTREITDVYAVVTGSTPTPRSVLLCSKYVGGSDFFYNAGPPVSGQKGSSWGIGPNNVGLTATVFGRVTGTATNKFYITDGYAIPGGLPISCISGITIPSVGKYVKVTGLVETTGILVISQSGITIIQ